MINPISILMTLASRHADIQRIQSLYSKNRAENTEMIDLVRSLAGDLGVLDAPANQQPASGLEKYGINWVQRSLNLLMNAGLLVDGQTGAATDEAVKRFQIDQNKRYPDRDPLTVDGRSGVITAGRIAEELGKIK